jgi:flagellar hook-length control protein FliK
VVIQINPHTEPAPIQEQRPPQEGGAAESQKTQSEKNKIGVFAKILAGLTGRATKTGTAGQTTGLENPHNVPLAETAGKKGKGVRVETAALAEKPKTKKSLETGTQKPELTPHELSEQEKGLFAIGRLTGQGEETGIPKEVKGEAGEGLKAEKRNLGREAVKPETADAHFQNEDPAKAEKSSLIAGTSAETAKAAGEIAENANAKAKNRPNSAETAVKNRSTVGEIAGDPEAKKVLTGPRTGNERNRLEEARNRRKGATFEVRDFRSQTTNAPQHGIPVPAGFEARLPAEGTGKDIVLELRLPSQGQDTATTSWEAKATQSFENILARELHQNLNNDIVRHASVALRDGNEGTIKLALKPESLGNVKIHLELVENKIIGHIVVESEEALRAFQKEISSLEKAFRDSGFEAANLEMSLASDGRGAENQWQEAEASQFLNEQFAASRYDAAIEQTELPLTLEIYEQGATAINLLA